MSVPTQTLIKVILLLLLPTLDVAPCVAMLAIAARRSGSLADDCVSCGWRGVDPDASRMSVEVGVMVGDLVLSLVVVLYDVLK